MVDLQLPLVRRPDAVRVVQVGLAGGIGFCHLNEYAANPYFKLVGGYDKFPTHPKVAEAIAPLRQAGGRIYQSFEEVLADPHVEAVDLCTPHHFHRPMAVAAFQAGKHVLVEKPMASHPDDVKLMLAAQRASGKVGAVQMQHLGRSSLHALRHAIHSGAIGTLQELKLSSLWFREEAYYTRLPWCGRMKIEGAWCVDGVLLNQCIHFITQMLVLATPPTLQGQAVGGMGGGWGGGGVGETIRVGRVENLRAALYKFHQAPTLEAGDTVFAVGTLALGQELSAALDPRHPPQLTLVGTTCAATENHRIEFVGTRGRALWNEVGYLHVNGQPVQEFHDDRPLFDGTSQVFTSWAKAIRASETPAGVARGATRPLTDLAALADATEFIFQCYQAAQWQIKPVPWAAVTGLLPTIEQVLAQRGLPAELAAPPAWA